jgi:signal peptidase I
MLTHDDGPVQQVGSAVPVGSGLDAAHSRIPVVRSLVNERPLSDAPAHRRRRWPVVLAICAGTLIGLLVVGVVVARIVFHPYAIPTSAMEPTLQIGDTVLARTASGQDVRRGDVVVFDGRLAGGWSTDGPQTDYIKRVIALPGDRVWCCTDGRLTVQPADGSEPVQIVESYTSGEQEPFCAAGTASCPEGAEPVLVPAGHLFVLGDARDRSQDSRAHLDNGQGGGVPMDAVHHRAVGVLRGGSLERLRRPAELEELG